MSSLLSKRTVTERTTYENRPAPVDIRSSTYSTSRAKYSSSSAYLPSYKTYDYVPASYSHASTAARTSVSASRVYSTSAYLPSYANRYAYPTSTYYRTYRPSYTRSYEVYSPRKYVTTSTIVERPITTTTVIEKPVTTTTVIERPAVTSTIIERPVTTSTIIERPVTTTYRTYSPLTHSYLYSKPAVSSYTTYYERPLSYSTYSTYSYPVVEERVTVDTSSRIIAETHNNIATAYDYDEIVRRSPYRVRRVLEI